VNPKIEVERKQEVLKLYKAGIIYPIKHYTWVANLVPVRKKNGEIQLCVDLKGLNRVSLKDHYPLPPMEQILNTMVGAERFSLLDGFSGYNQVWVKNEDQFKMAFTTKWGTFYFQRMPFGLSNVGETFQRTMDYAFGELVNKTVLVYLDDITIFSHDRSSHV